MTKAELTSLIRTATRQEKADLVLKNAQIVNVFQHRIDRGDVAVKGRYIVGIGDYQGEQEVDLRQQYVVPGFIDGHIHIESTFVSPEELGRLLVPHGTSTLIADPHEIVNVFGLTGFRYMLEAARRTALDVKYMVPSCVPATGFETSGANIEACDMEEPMKLEDVLGLGEFMNSNAIVHADPQALDKLFVAFNNGKLVDGHSPGVTGDELNAYLCAGIHTDHECTTLEEMDRRLSGGMYVLLRQGTIEKDLENLLPGVTDSNSRHCLFCTDDRHLETIYAEGHLEEHLRLCVRHHLDPVTAIQMATINAAECYRLSDRGAIAPGRLADIAVLQDLKDFNCTRMYMRGELVARDGVYLPEVEKYPIDTVRNTVVIKDTSPSCFSLKLASDTVAAISPVPGSVLSKKKTVTIRRNSEGEFLYDPDRDIIKVAVVERHQGTGNVATALLEGFGLRGGAIAQSIAHDSHNIIVAGTSDSDMTLAVRRLEEMQGGLVLVQDGQVIDSIPMPIAGLMSDQPSRQVADALSAFNRKAHDLLSISPAHDPTMTLAFMALPVIPELKLTDRGLFDVTTFSFLRQ